MSTITKERLEWLANISGRDDIDEIDGEEIRELARIALASLEAEPVGYVDAEYAELLRSGHIESCSVYAEQGEGCIALYVAPPAPVSVPEWTNEQCLEFLSIAFRHAEIKGDLQFDDIRLGVKMVNGSRAAMLQGAEPVTTAYKLPDGWVACSERMPEIYTWVHVYSPLAYIAEQILPDRLIEVGDPENGPFWDYHGREGVTHWMPLPAAPQQEVKS
ncbi:hypothetical protein ABR39_04160 [Enterobacter genomosp. O]|uniref:DUF551 domain-containing protein n=1 Tax=Enterobacter genomosp. O TaxID=2364150 RepID=UPI0006432A13|nr:DUF551 domain-containing protein [Enterobacter genomosp. O]KLP57433.1 hypothetical protein ABR39_04160 [Enterobacter genomosp. O]